MAKLTLLLCFSILFASGTLLGVVSPTFLHAIEEPKTVNDVEPYTVKVVMSFVVDLEKECPKTQEFRAFFDRLKAFAKYVCPIAKAIGRKDANAYESDMKAKAGSLFQAMSAFAAKKSSRSRAVMVLKREQREAMNIVGSMQIQSIFSKIMSRRNQAESDGSTELTAEQKQAIKDRITKWQQVITRVVKTMVQTSTESSTQTQESTVNVNGGSEVSINGKEADNKGGNGDSAKAQTQVLPRGSADVSKGYSEDALRSSPVEIRGDVGASANGNAIENRGNDTDSTNDKATDNQGGNGGFTNGSKNKGSNANSTTDANASNWGDSTKNASVEIQGGVQGSMNGGTTVDAKGGSGNVTNSVTSETSGNTATSEAVVSNTWNGVLTFIMNLEKKCPATEEFKAFFEKLKAYMKYACPVSSMVGKKNPKSYMSEMISIATKLSDAMSLVQARMSKSRETKNTMQSYQQEMMKTLSVLQDVASNVVNENQSKQEGSVTVTETQQKVIKETITKWEQVTTQFVETAVQSETETQSRTKTEASSEQSNAENRKTKSLQLN